MDVYVSSCGKLLNVASKQKSRISLTRNEYDLSQSDFSITGCFEFSFPSSQSKCIACSTCEETLTGTQITVALIENESGNTIDYYFVAFSLDSEKFIPLRKLKLNQRLTSFNIVDGPMVVWTEGNSLNFSTPSPKHPCHLCKYVVADILHSVTLITVKQHTDHYFMVGKWRPDTNTCCLFLYVLVPSVSNSETYTVRQLDVDSIVSTLYTNICGLLITDIELSGNDPEQTIQSSVFSVTEEGYVLKFVNGELIFAVPTNSNFLEVNLHYFECVPVQHKYLSIYSAGQVQILNTESKKVVQSWLEVTQVFCDDFVQNGGQQLLILTEGFDRKSGFILTDVDIIHTDNTSHRVQNGQETKKANNMAAVTALQTRLRNEVVSLNELSAEMQERKQHFTELWTKSAKLNLGEPVRDIHDPMLVSLIGEDNRKFDSTLTDEESTHGIQVHSLWKRTYGKNLVVGVEITNNAKSTKFVSLVVVPVTKGITQVMTFTSACFDLGKSTTKMTSEKASKRRRILPTSLSNYEGCETYCLEIGHTATLMCKTDMPSLTSIRELVLTASLQITEKSEGSGSKGNYIVNAGEITLSPLDSVEGRHEIIISNTCSGNQDFQPTDLQRNVLTLNFVQVSLMLSVRATRFPLSQLSHWLLKKAGALWVEEYDCMVISSKPVFHGTRLYMEDDFRTSKDVKLKVFTNDKDQLYLLLQHLYSILPDDVIFVPTNDNHDEINQSVISLQTEITKTSILLHELFEKLQPLDNESAEIELDKNGQSHVDNVRKNFAKKKQCAQTKARLQASGEDCAKVCQGIEDIQMKSDTDYIKLMSFGDC